MKWISVKERKPEIDETVLVWTTHKNAEGMRLLMGHRMTKVGKGKDKWAVGIWEGRIDEADHWKITHWMPLPEGPE